MSSDCSDSVEAVDGIGGAAQAVSTDDITWVARALQEERLAVEVLLAQRHSELLLWLNRNSECIVLPAMLPERSAPGGAEGRQAVVSPKCLREDRELGAAPPEAPLRHVEVKESVSSALSSSALSTVASKQSSSSVVQDVEVKSSRSYGRSYSSEQPGHGDDDCGVIAKKTSHFVDEVIHELEEDDLDEEESEITPPANRRPPVLRRWSSQVPGSCLAHRFLGDRLDVISCTVISLNFFTMALQTQYHSYDLENDLPKNVSGYPELGNRPAEEVWPDLGTFFDLLEWGFGIFFCVELLLRVVFQIQIREDIPWNLLDMLIIASWVIERFSLLSTGFNPAVLRMVRLVRLIRLAKLLRHMRIFDPLYLIIKSIQSSMSVLMWAVGMIFILMMLVAMVNTSVLEGFISDRRQSDEARVEIFLRWGSFMRAYISMFEITLANWGPQCWLLMNEVHELWGFFFIFWRCCFGFAVIQVITSVFIQHTFQVANRDEVIMIKERERSALAYLKHLEKLFERMDRSGDGKISRGEFDAALQEPRVRHWFAALEINMASLPAVYQMLENGSGEINKDEFIDGLRKMKGQAQGIDLLALRKDVHKLHALIQGEAMLRGIGRSSV